MQVECRILGLRFLQQMPYIFIFVTQLTWADICVALYHDVLDNPDELGFKGVPNSDIRFKMLDNFPLLAKHQKMVMNQNGIKEWIKARSVTPI